MDTITSGAAASTSAHSAVRDFSPARPRTSMPPAISIICGTQWPPMKTGSSHSSARTGIGSAEPTASLTSSSRSAATSTSCSPSSGTPAASASRGTSASTSPMVVGSSEITSGREGSRSATARTSSKETAHTSHTAWVTISSGSCCRQRLLVELVQRLALRHVLAHGGVDLGRRQALGDHARRSGGAGPRPPAGGRTRALLPRCCRRGRARRASRWRTAPVKRFAWRERWHV